MRAMEEFEKVEAASYALVDLPTGTPVGAAHDRGEVYSLLDEVREDSNETLDDLLVVALGDSGRRLGPSWRASELYLPA